ncbi:MAG: selenide, water dikinase SelD [Mongoliibacter sp.]|uniref:selenide, water dikinase SelD n=1 Tax=Mongoliibacter sp. TaxID=2022438 RepID=UPI0012F102DD|nr:selenide, water dikinase SelD [Mongoliibacter sp.]TVP49603.1 MAG: selenide, water dikinase SelD [Mongoliibacter sp.]
MNEIKLTAFSHGAGCGCKISPAILSEMLQTDNPFAQYQNIIVGNSTKDDAAVYDMGDGTGIITTTDFFMPIVDDPFTFGQIAATNAISDIFAMGGQPIMAIAIFGWPIEKLSTEIARQVLAGGREVCLRAGSPLVGGHSIDSPEPIFGLAVTGRIDLKHLKRNDTATEGCKLYLTKPLGVGILATAEKKGNISPAHVGIAAKSMTTLNAIGRDLSKMEGVKAMTDVTGFGLLGHLVEMCEGSNLSAEIDYAKVPVFKEVHLYLEQGNVPGGTYRNWSSYGHHVRLKDDSFKEILCDPQTSGGLLVAVEKSAQEEVEKLFRENGIVSEAIGEMRPKAEYMVEVD